jgi:hypothetical protein
VESVSTAADHLAFPPGLPCDPGFLEFFVTIRRPLISWDAVHRSKTWVTPDILPHRSAGLRHQKAVRFTDKGCRKMGKGKAHWFWVGIFALWFSTVHAQNPQQIIQQVVNTERAADQNDHSNWIYLEESDKPKEHVLQWVAATQQGNVERVLERDARQLPETEQRELIQKYLHDSLIWTQTGATATTTSLHFDPAPNFRPPTREARVFSSMTGDLVVDNQQHRICKVKGHLMHDVTFGGGLLGRLKERSSFALEQQQVGPSVWELTAIHVHLEGNALLFKSVSLQQDDKRSKFYAQASGVTLEQAATSVMSEAKLFACSDSLNSGPATEEQVGCVEKLTVSTGLKH